MEIVRRIHERWRNEESMRDLVADDLEYVNPTYAVEPGTRIGRDAFGSVRETYPDFQLHVERFIDAGDEVVVLGRYTASGGASGIELEGGTKEALGMLVVGARELVHVPEATMVGFPCVE